MQVKQVGPIRITKELDVGIFSRFERSMEDGLEGAADKLFDAPISPVQISKKAEKAMRREKMVGAGKQYAPTLYTVLVNPEDDARLEGYYPTLAGETETFLAGRAAEEGLAMDGQPLVRFFVDESLKRGKFDIVAELVSAPIVAQLRREEMKRYGLLGSNAAPAPAQPNRARAQRGQQVQQVPAVQGDPWAQDAYAQQQPVQAPLVQEPYAQAEPAASAQRVHRAGQDSLADPQVQIPLPQAQPAAEQVPLPKEAAKADYDHEAYAARLAQSHSNPIDVADAVAQVPAAPARKQPLPYVPEEEIDRSIDYGEYTFNSQDFEDYAEHGASAQPVSQPVATPEQPWVAEADLDLDADADLSGFDVEAYNPYAHDSRDFFVADTPAANPPTAAVPDAWQASGAAARIVDKSTNRTYDLVANRLIMGRSSSCDIVLDDISASRSHAELRQESPGVWILTDLGSTNGTQVNGEAIASCELELGDRIVIGTTELVFVQD